ncbi:trypsin-like peptidase domain-containing protein [Streptomyces sp. NPDC020807]|uniref:trypsin-like peptidase domain-containing protein n=1 Tax=Streptomyces sp. NPDC020807 TaxID=3155119 RepID=UPI0034079890
MGRGDLATLVSICDPAGRRRGTGFLADHHGTVVTSHEAVDGLTRVLLRAPGDLTCLAGPEAVTPLPESGLALVRTEGLGLRPVALATRPETEPGTYVRIAAQGWREARVLGPASVTYTTAGGRHRLGHALELAIGTEGAEALRLDGGAAGGPVLDTSTGTVLAVLGTALRGERAGAGYAVTVRGDGPLATLLRRNAATVPAYGPDLNLAGILELTATSTGPVRDPDPWPDPVERPVCVREFTRFAEGDALVMGLVGAPGTGRTTALAALCARRARGAAPAPTVRLRGADLRAEDGSLADAVGRALRQAGRIVTASGALGDTGAATPERAAALAREADRPLLVVLDGPEEMPPLLAHRLPDWTEATERWLRDHGARLVTACRPEHWDLAGTLYTPAALHRPAEGPTTGTLGGTPRPRAHEGGAPPAEGPGGGAFRAGGPGGGAASAAGRGGGAFLAGGAGGGAYRAGAPGGGASSPAGPGAGVFLAGGAGGSAASDVPGAPGAGATGPWPGHGTYRVEVSGGGACRGEVPGGWVSPPALVLGAYSEAEARAVREGYGLGEGDLAEADARHPLALRLLAEVRAALPGAVPGRPGREEIFHAHLDLMCLRVAVRVAAGSRPLVRGTAVRVLAARVAGQVHEAARRCLGPGHGVLDRASFEELFPWREGWASAVLTEGLLVPAGTGYRFAHEELADWLQASHLDLDTALDALVHSRATPPGAAAADGTVPEGRRAPGDAAAQAVSVPARAPEVRPGAGSPYEAGFPYVAGSGDGSGGLATATATAAADPLAPAVASGLPSDVPVPVPVHVPRPRAGGSAEAVARQLPVPRHRIGPVLQALLRLHRDEGPSALAPRLAALVTSLDRFADAPDPVDADAVWWAGRLLREAVREVGDPRPYLPVLRLLADRIGGRSPRHPVFAAFGVAFWRALPVGEDERMDLLRRQVPADPPASPPSPYATSVPPRALDLAARLLAADPRGVQPLLCRWFGDERALPAAPHATVATAAQALLHTHRSLAVDDLCEALVATAHPLAEGLLGALVEDDPSAVCRAVDRWAHDDGRPERRVAAAVYGERVAGRVHGPGDRELLRYAAAALLARPADRRLHGTALGLLVRDPETRARHLPRAIAEPRVPAAALAEALATHPGPVLTAFRSRLHGTGDEAGEALRALAEIDTPALTRRIAALVRDYVARLPDGAGHVARYVDRRFEDGPTARAVLFPLVSGLIRGRPAAVRRALAPVLAAPGTGASRHLRAELLDVLLEHERYEAETGEFGVLDALLTAAAEGAGLRSEPRTREIVRRVGMLYGRSHEGGGAFDRALGGLAHELPGFAGRLRGWVRDAPGEWAPLLGPETLRALRFPGTSMPMRADGRGHGSLRPA